MDIETFAGFTQAEWAMSYSRVMDADAAAREAEDLFRAVATSGSNGYALTADQWALLAALGQHAERRVQERIADYPLEFRQQVALAIDEIRVAAQNE